MATLFFLWTGILEGHCTGPYWNLLNEGFGVKTQLKSNKNLLSFYANSKERPYNVDFIKCLMENVLEFWNGMAIPCIEQMVAMKTVKFNEPRVALWGIKAPERDNWVPVIGPILIIWFSV